MNSVALAFVVELDDMFYTCRDSPLKKMMKKTCSISRQNLSVFIPL